KYLNIDFFQQLSTDLKTVYPTLNKNKFYQQCIKPLDSLELKQRITHTTQTVASHLPQNYKKSINVLYDFSEIIDEKLGYLFMPEFVATFGKHDFKTSIKALRDFSEHSSSEFAVRDFINLDLEHTLKHMLEWSENDNEHIRRLASEGCRPRLPWASKLPQIIEQPALSWPILNKLKNDPAKYVQKSIANHLNDISKDNPEWMIKKISRWNQKNHNTAWIIRHGCRSLIKQADPTTLEFFNYLKPSIKLSRFKLSTDSLRLGESLDLSFDISSTSNITQNIVIDYSIYYLKKNGRHQPKVFKLKSFEIAAKASHKISKTHRFQALTTRKHYAGEHWLEIIINGKHLHKQTFQLDLNN
ncbi:MAG: DNA alkylation repair protein, partial [Gammaproteobacteria bacterium]|nr:DNA alkylation repair protein [Gammaproteobacteria bacterium]